MSDDLTPEQRQREDGTDPYVPGHGTTAFTVQRYELELDYRMASNLLDARARLVCVAARDLSRFSLDLVGLTVSKTMVDRRRPAKFKQRAGKLHVTPALPIGTGEQFTVDVAYSGSPRPYDGVCGDVGWEELDDGVLVAGQPEGAPTWFPCNDHPADKASYHIVVSTESAYHVIANGVLTDRRVRGSRTTWTYEQAEPMATYLATVQIGRYAITTQRERPEVPLRVAFPPDLRARCEADLHAQSAMLDVFEAAFGPYPFEQYTVVVTADDLEIPLEAQGVSVFGANHIDGLGTQERLVAHELAHQWFGNSLTPASWQHVWLNEGFACYAEWLWSEASGGPSTDALARQHWSAVSRLPRDLLLADPGADLMFDDRVYKRGALTLHALRRTIGDEAFFDLLRQWTAHHRHGVVSTQDFLSEVDQHSSANLTGRGMLLDKWLNTLALPRLPS